MDEELYGGSFEFSSGMDIEVDAVVDFILCEIADGFYL